MQHGGKLEIFPFCGTLFIKKKATRENLPQINNKYGSIPKEFHRDKDTPGYGTPKSTFQCHNMKVNSVRFNDTYNYINTQENTDASTIFVNATDEHLSL